MKFGVEVDGKPVIYDVDIHLYPYESFLTRAKIALLEIIGHSRFVIKYWLGEE